MVENLLSDADSSDIFTEDATRSYYKSGLNFNSNMSQNKQVIQGYERSEGEIGAPSVGEMSDVRFPCVPRSLAIVQRNPSNIVNQR